MDEFEVWSRDGDLAPEREVELLRRLAAQYTRTHSFPPPEGYDHWSDDAVDYLLADFYEQKGAAIVVSALFDVASQSSLERLLLTVIASLLKDQAKGTPRGKLRRRLENVLGEDARFARVTTPGLGWCIADSLTGPWQGSVRDLDQAAASARGYIITRWNASGPTPEETKRALREISFVILTFTGGIVRDEDLARVLISRFPLIDPSLGHAGDDHADLEGQTGELPEQQFLVQEHAEETWESLSQAERSIVAHLDQPGTELAKILGVGTYKARATAERLKESLRRSTLDDDQAQAVILALVEICRERP